MNCKILSFAACVALAVLLGHLMSNKGGTTLPKAQYIEHKTAWSYRILNDPYFHFNNRTHPLLQVLPF
jgi:hypothetical protein